MSCNIRTSHASDGPNSWEMRKAFALEVIGSRNPDVICFQEMTALQRDFFAAELAGFTWLGTPDHPTRSDPVNSIFFRTDTFNLISSGSYWLSRTPHIAGSKFWRSRCTRLVTWIQLEDAAAATKYRIINTHLDHISQPARVAQAKVITRDCARLPDNTRQILAGDLNCDASNRVINLLSKAGFKDTYEAIHGTDNPGMSCHAFKGEQHRSALGKIDWILVKGPINVTGAEIIKDSVDGRYPSDHYFLRADIT